MGGCGDNVTGFIADNEKRRKTQLSMCACFDSYVSTCHASVCVCVTVGVCGSCVSARLHFAFVRDCVRACRCVTEVNG